MRRRNIAVASVDNDIVVVCLCIVLVLLSVVSVVDMSYHFVVDVVVVDRSYCVDHPGGVPSCSGDIGMYRLLS